MSTHHPEGSSSGPLQAPPPPPQYPGQPYGDPNQPYRAPYGQPGFDLQRQRTNVMAILGLVFAFVFSPLGIVFSVIGLSQIKKRREGGKGLAISGLVLSIVFLLISLLMILLVLPAVVTVAKERANAVSAPAAQPAPVQQTVDPVTEDAQGIVRACTVIIPALRKSNVTLPAASTREEYVQLVMMLRTAIETAAHTSTDPVFVQDVLTLSQDMQQALGLSESQDNTALEKTFSDALQAVEDDCRAAGYVG